MTQSAAILAHLQAGHSITPLDALDRFGCFRLGARVYDLKRLGHDIQSETFELPNGKHVARYWLPIPRGQLDLFGTRATPPLNTASRAGAQPALAYSTATQSG